MDPIIRRASAADVDLLSSLNADVQALHADAVRWRFKPPSAGAFSSPAAAWIEGPSNIVLIAEIDGQAAGYAYAEILRNPETPFRFAYDAVHLHHISVRAAYRRKGAGAALLQAVRAAGQDLGIALVTLDVWMFNDEARAFFRRRGFTPYVERLWNRPCG